MTTRKALADFVAIPRGELEKLVKLTSFNTSALAAHVSALAAAALAQPEPKPVGWFESPHGAFRANPDYRLTFPSQLLKWSVPVYLSSAAPPPPATPVDAHELWAAAQLVPGEGIEDGVARIEAMLGAAAQPLSDEQIALAWAEHMRVRALPHYREFARAIERAVREQP